MTSDEEEEPDYEAANLPKPVPEEAEEGERIPDSELPDPDAGADLPAKIWCLRCEDRLARRGSRFCLECWHHLQWDRRKRERDR